MREPDFTRRWRRRTRATGTAALIAIAGAARATTFYVSPKGDDAWPGTQDRPFASLDTARLAVRKLGSVDPLKEPVKVIVADGFYTMKQPLVFEPQDTGTVDGPISYEAAPDAHPVFSGGRAITGWTRGANGIWTTRIPDVQAGKWYFSQLWINGRRATRARSPNAFYFYAAGGARPGDDPSHGDPKAFASRAFRARAEDVAALASLTAAQLKDVELTSFLVWTSTIDRVTAIEPKSATVLLLTAQGFGVNRYVLENYRAALDAPGEWFLDRDGTLSYLPLADEDMTKANVVAPTVEHLLTISGDLVHARKSVEHLRFVGLSFQFGDYVLPPEGHHDGQAEATLGAAITLDGARDVGFENCEIAHAGLAGIWFRAGCSSDRVVHCRLTDLGGGGVKIGPTTIELDESLHTDHITIDNNIIHGVGRIHHGAVGVWIGQSGDNAVTHNDIADLDYTGISVGWTWGYGPSLAQRNAIEFNHIHHVGQGVLSDMGGIYTLGISDGATVRGNHVHDVNAYTYGGWGLYADEGTTHVRFTDNLVHDAQAAGFHQHYGKENEVANNIFAHNGEAQLERTRVEDHTSFTFEHNVVWSPGGAMLKGDWTRGLTLRDNVFFDGGDATTVFDGQSFDAWRAAVGDVGSVFADPKFVDAAHGDFALRPDSPAIAKGFKPFPLDQAGVYGDDAWKHAAADDPMPAFVRAPTPPPRTIDEDFESTPVGSPPADAIVYGENEASHATIRVNDQVAATGKQSLELHDAAGLPNAWDPHCFWEPHHLAGTSTASFDVRVEPDAVLMHEWRDDAHPYKVGPSLTIDHGSLVVAGKGLMSLPPGQWAHVTITAKLGASAAGTWDITVTPRGTPTRTFAGLKFGTPDFNRLDWFGFISNATTPTACELDNLKLDNTTY